MPGKQTAVEQAKIKVADAAKAVVCASDVFHRACNDLEILQREIIEKRVIMRFFSRVAPVPSAAEKRIENLLMPELPPHPKQATFTNWDIHPSFVEWANALARLMTDPDAEIPDA